MTISDWPMEIDADRLADIVTGTDSTVIVDCRCFSDYNRLHVRNAVNAFYSKLMRRRLEANKVDAVNLIGQILGSTAILPAMMDLVLYAEDNDRDAAAPPARILQKRRCSGGISTGESSAKMIRLLKEKLEQTSVFSNIMLLKGGFSSFRSAFPDLCESSAVLPTPLQSSGGCSMSSSSPLQRPSLSQPCLPQGTDGPTEILPFLFLGGQADALNKDTLKKHNITYVLNLSISCPRSDAVESEENFLRIPVNDNYQEKLLPYFDNAFHFLENVRKRGAVALIHCLAGISRSPTLAISYIMKHKGMTSDEAYKFVKSKRQSISPNFNFMGQLLEYERKLREDGVLPPKSDCYSPTYVEKQDFCPAKVPKSSSTMGLFCSLPTSLSAFPSATPSLAEHTLPPNENGKRLMGLAPDRPALLEGTVLSAPSRPVALGLKSRKPVNIPTSLAEDLPSPSSELEKLTFTQGTQSLANPCFVSPDAHCRPPVAAMPMDCAARENPIFGRTTALPSLSCRSALSAAASAPPSREFALPCRSSHFEQISVPRTLDSVDHENCQEDQQGSVRPQPEPQNHHGLRYLPFKVLSFFRKPDPCGPSAKMSRSATTSAALSSLSARPESLSQSGVQREQASSVPPQSSMSSNCDDADSPESGYQEEYKTSPEQEPDRASIGSASSHEIAVQ